MRGVDSYIKIYELLGKKYKENSVVTLEELSTVSNLKISTLKVYIRNKLKGKYLKKEETDEFLVLDEIIKNTKQEFINWMSQKSIDVDEKTSLKDNLIENSIQSMLSAIELHNKPQISYRYQVVVILVINSWELALKAYLAKFHPEIKLINADKSTKPFPECLRAVEANLGKKILPTINNLELLYKYRCDFIHFYNDELDILLFSLIQKAIIFYNKFLSIYFDKNLSSYDDLYFLPIGFKKPISPIDFISNESFIETAPEYVKDFFDDIVEKTSKLVENQIEELIFVPYSMNLTNVKRIKNADIVAAISDKSKIKIQIEENVIISKSEDAKEIRIEENDLYEKIYNLRFIDIVEFCKANIPNWKRNNDFYAHMRELKQEPSLHKVRFLDPKNLKGSKKDFYSKEILVELKKRYGVTI